MPLSLRVATYNIHKGVLREGLSLRRVARIHELRARLHEIDADLILLQEVQGRHERHARRFEHWPAEPQDVFLSRVPGRPGDFETAYGANAHYLHGHHGNALLSRFPILHRDNRDFSDHVLEKRGVLHCVVDAGSTSLHCFVVHFGLFAGGRQRQLEALIDWIRRAVPANSPLIIGGDFNDWRNQLSRRLCDSIGVVEVFDACRPRAARTQQAVRALGERLVELGVPLEPRVPSAGRVVRGARTFPSLVPWLRMDRIYVRGFEVRDVRVPRGTGWARLSDHSPVIADLVHRPGPGDARGDD